MLLVSFYQSLAVFCVGVCVENEGDSSISAANTQQSSSSVQVLLKDETKSAAEAAKLSTEFVAEVIDCCYIQPVVLCTCYIYYGLEKLLSMLSL